MNMTYAVIEHIWKRCLADEEVDVGEDILALLSRQEIKTRQIDGVLRQINLSIPTSINSAFVIGLRYIKNDGTCTEDHFLCRNDIEPSMTQLSIEPHYGRRLEIRLSEYRGTHKQQVDITHVDKRDAQVTQVNTISYLICKK